ncbi:MAG: DUF3854 domain-containing protein [Nostocaceae cyanobacterium]|nr:DUF3854 domain-containing protein [Nostocaceae cyanobacterium]
MSQFTDTTQHPNNLTDAEYHELHVKSGIDPRVIAKNFFHLDGNQALERLLISDKIPRLNSGRVTSSFLKKYRHIEAGGWWCNGLDPHNNWMQMEWGRFKPNQPRIYFENGKVIKYESPPLIPNHVTYFDVPDFVWDWVAARYNIKRYESKLMWRLQDKIEELLFWAWVKKHPEIPIILAEGEKKAALLLSLGYVAIALPGIWNGRVGQKDLDERLHPDIMPLAQPGRKFIILFDYETNPKTRYAVFQAIVRTGKAIEAAGCKCEVAELPGPEKGIDDFVVARGGVGAEVVVTKIIDDAKSLSHFQRSFRHKPRGLNKYTPDKIVNSRYLSDVVDLDRLDVEETEVTDITALVREKRKALTSVDVESEPVLNSLCHRLTSTNTTQRLMRFIVLKNDMGTGKTELMQIFRNNNPHKRFLNNGHRVNLLKNLSERLKTQMYSELSIGDLAKAQALSITADSLHKLSTNALEYDCVFIDEACQYLVHLLHSNTCKENRGAILEVLQYIVGHTSMLVLADAHMDDTTIDFFLAMLPDGVKPYIIENKFKNGGRKVFWYNGKNPSALVAQIAAALMEGRKVMVVSDSKRFIKKLEKLLNMPVDVDYGPEDCTPESKQKLRVWAIHGDNSGSEENVVFIKDITQAVKSVDALLASPSLGTGVDIAEYHFDVVFGVFHASTQTATECTQQLHRYRPNVPFHIWVAPKPSFGYKETNAAKIKETILQKNILAAFLIRIDPKTGARGAEKDWALDAYCQIEADRNASINNLRDDLRELLADMGNEIIPLEDDDDEDCVTKQKLKDADQALKIEHYAAVSSAKDITLKEYLKQQSKDYLKPSEVFECEKFRITEAYGMEVTESLVERDDGGKLIKALAAFEAINSESDGMIIDGNGNEFAAPPKLVAEKDLAERLRLAYCMDWGNYSAQWQCRFFLGLNSLLKRLVTGVRITNSDPELVAMVSLARKHRPHIKAILGFTIPENPKDCSPKWLLSTLIEQLGLKLETKKVGPVGQQVRHFWLLAEKLEFALSVLAHRERKRQLKEERKRQEMSEHYSYQAGIQAQYGIAPNYKSISNHPSLANDFPSGVGVEISFSPPDSWGQRLRNYVQTVINLVEVGVDKIKQLLSTLPCDERLLVMCEFEETNAEKFAQLMDIAPNWVEWCME